jgi:osmoprotectant transport system permease protein
VLTTLRIRPNRIASGEAFALWQISPVLTLMLACTVAALLVLALSGRLTPPLTLAAALLLLAVLLASLLYGGEILSRRGYDYGRISPSSGFWLLLLAAYILFNRVYRSAAGRKLRSASLLLPVALLVIFALAGGFSGTAVTMELESRAEKFIFEIGRHLALSFSAVGLATVIGIPAALAAYRKKALRDPVFTVVNGIQTIPSLALFGLMLAPLAALSRSFPLLREVGISGIGNAPALIALTLYSLLPITRNTFTGLSVIAPAVREAGSGMGMNRRQLLRYIEVPLALPIILTGLRISLVQCIGNTTVAALIGAGGLGTFVFQGLGQAAPDLIVAGVLPIILLSISVDRGMLFLTSLATSEGLKSTEETEGQEAVNAR